ncbi:MAG: Crp/Fnr family transcriptional regulator [Bacteroidales bacterium]|nr:Crp/Fnr family transcriptional regulator [Bacteroidales bacterium]
MSKQGGPHNDFDKRTEPDCFHLITQEDYESISENRTQLTYLRDENIFKQGAFAPYVLFIQTGLVKVYIQTGGKKKLNLWIARSGDFLAFSCVFGENIYHYSAVALKDSELLMIEKESLKKLLNTNPEFALRITSKNYGTEKHLLEIVTNLSSKQMRGKLASSLLYLSSEVFLKEQVFDLLIRQDIADFASISVESVIKFLKEFEKEGIIALDGKNIKIPDPEKLSAISKTG